MTKKEIQEVKSPWTKEQLALITNTVAKGATQDELKLFLYTASRTKLDPLTKQIHFVKRGGQMTVQTGIDGYRTIAERSGTLAGIDDATYDSEEGPQPKKATVTVYRMVNGERVPFTASARWSEYAPQGNQAFMWNKMPYLMLAKCAEALALRKAFPNDLTGLYTNEEMAQAEPPTIHSNTEVKNSDADVIDENVNANEVIEGQVLTPNNGDATGKSDASKKHCPFCGDWHTGQFEKCINCWKDERAGKKLVKQKTIINNDAPPFP